MTTPATTKRRPIGLLYGSITGAVTALIAFILSRGGVQLYLSPIGHIGNAFTIAMAVFAALAVKKHNGGYIDFQDAIKTCFTVIVFGLAAVTLFNWILLNFVDPNFKNLVNIESLKRTHAMLQKLGYREDEIDRLMADQKQGNPYSFGNLATGFAIWSIVGFIFAIIIAAIVKKKKTGSTDQANLIKTGI